MNKNNKSVKWIVVAAVAAGIAAITTVAILLLRAKAKKKAWYEDAAFEYDMDDCECFDDFDGEVIDITDEVVD